MQPPVLMPERVWPNATPEDWLPKLAAWSEAERADWCHAATTLSSPEEVISALHLALALARQGERTAALELAHSLAAQCAADPVLLLAARLIETRILLTGLQADPQTCGDVLELLAEARTLAEESGQSGRLPVILGYTGLVHRLAGNYDAALPALREASEADHAALDAIESATIWNNRGLAELELGMYEEAAASFQQALQRFRPLGQPRYLAPVAQNIGFIYLELERYPEAQEYTRKARDWYQALGDASLNHFHTLGNLAAIAIRLNSLEEAQDALEQAAAIANRLEHPVAAQLLHTNRGALAEEHLERAEAAGDLAAAEISRHHAQTEYTAALQVAEEHQLADRRWRAQLRLGDILISSSKREEMATAWRYLNQAREGFRQQHRSLRDIRAHRAFLTQQRSLYGTLIRAALAQGDDLLAWSLVQEAKQAGWTLGLPGRYPTEPLPSLPYTHNLGLELLNVLWENGQLATGEGLLDFYVARETINGVTSETIYRFAHAPGRGLQTRALSLVPVRLLRTVLGHWQEQLQQYEQTPVQDQQSLRLPAAGWLASLSRVLLEGVQDHLGPLTGLMICPHGPLHEVPWLALEDEHGSPLLETCAIQLVPYWAHLEPPDWTPPPPLTAPQALILGGETAGLSHVEQETAALATALGSRPAIRWPDGHATVHEAIAAALPTAWLWHCAGHGKFDPQSPSASYLEAGTAHLSAREFLAGELHGPHLQLLTLAACETARMQAGPASLVDGFLRAFLATGTRAIAAGAWKIRDDLTAAAMEVFYRRVLAEGTVAEGIREAALTLRAQGFDHPYFWAGYQSWGTPRIAVPAAEGATV